MCGSKLRDEDDPRAATATAARAAKPSPETSLPGGLNYAHCRAGVDKIHVVGTHGGAGETSLATVLGEEHAVAAGLAWPWQEPSTMTDGKFPVILVCRSSMYGLRSAQSAITQWARGTVQTVDVIGLVVIYDAPGKLPRDLRAMLKIVAGGMLHRPVWEIPFIDSLRIGGELYAPHPIPQPYISFRAQAFTAWQTLKETA